MITEEYKGYEINELYDSQQNPYYNIAKVFSNDPYYEIWGMCTATYYVVKAKDEEEAYDRSGYNYDPDEDWAIDTYEKGLVSENCHWAETICEDEEEEND